MTKEIELESTFTPYTLDRYATFTFEGYEDDLIEAYNDKHGTRREYDDFEWAYNTKDYLIDLAENRLKLLRQNILDNVIIGIDADGEPTSPRYYNFDTDKAFNIWIVDIDALRRYVEEHKADYEENKLRDRDGFWWFGDEEQTMLNYYLFTESVKRYNKDDYFYNQLEQVDGKAYITRV